MTPSPDDKLASVKKGVKNLFRTRSQRRGTHEGESGPSTTQVSSSGAAVEAPNSTATPQLTTNIPGASLDADLPGSQPRDIPGASEAQEEAPPPPLILRRSYAAGMSATSGPLGGSLEEVEKSEKLQDHRTSVGSVDMATATEERQDVGTAGAGARNRATGSNDPSDTASGAASGAHEATVVGRGDDDIDMEDAW